MKKTITLFIFSFVFLSFLTTKNVFAGCSVLNTNPSTGVVGTPFTVNVQNCTSDINLQLYEVRIYDQAGLNIIATYPLLSNGTGGASAIITNFTTVGSYQVTIHNMVNDTDISAGGFVLTAATGTNTTKFECQTVSGGSYCFKCIYNGTTKVSCSTPNYNELGSCPSTCRQAVPGSATAEYTSSNVQGTCPTPNSIDTAIGCVPIGDINTFAGFFLKWGLGIAGGIGFLFLIYASFQVMTSQGDPKRLQTGKELLMSAVSGIILLAFSVLVLKILGVSILGIF